MLSEADEKLLLEACKTCRGSVDRMQSILSKVEDEDLSDDLNRQIGSYMRFINRAERELKKNGSKAYEEKFGDKLKSWSKVQKDTLFNTSTRHIANLVIEDNTRGIAYMLKAIHDNPESVSCEFAKELVEFEERNIEQLKYYITDSKH